jgi:hypothetical protein
MACAVLALYRRQRFSVATVALLSYIDGHVHVTQFKGRCAMPTNSPLAACCLPALPFLTDDFTARAAFQVEVREQGVWVEITQSLQDIPEAVEISWPGDRFDTRWLVWRNSAGVWIDEYDTNDRSGPLPTMALALEVTGRIMATERPQVRQVAPSQARAGRLMRVNARD